MCCVCVCARVCVHIRVCVRIRVCARVRLHMCEGVCTGRDDPYSPSRRGRGYTNTRTPRISPRTGSWSPALRYTHVIHTRAPARPPARPLSHTRVAALSVEASGVNYRRFSRRMVARGTLVASVLDESELPDVLSSLRAWVCAGVWVGWCECGCGSVSGLDQFCPCQSSVLAR